MPLAGRSSPTDQLFAALANPTRRAVLDLLLDGPQAAGTIADHFDMARPSVSEHLRVLRDAGLVTEARDGRHRHYTVRPEPLRDVQQWLSPYERFWRGALGDLRDFLDTTEPPTLDRPAINPEDP
jgi:DNA-binding transcriptional ArsR family regulator